MACEGRLKQIITIILLLLTVEVSSPLTDAEIEEICSQSYPMVFRFGILLGLEVPELDSIVDNSSLEAWTKCRMIIEKWRDNTLDYQERYY